MRYSNQPAFKYLQTLKITYIAFGQATLSAELASVN